VRNVRVYGQGARDKKQGMTLEELASFVQQALRMDVPGDTPVKVTNGFRQQIQKLEVKP
jgi:hypothetical protein